MESHEEVMLAPWSGHDPLGMVQTKNRGMCAHREKERVKLYTGNVDNIIARSVYE